VGYLVADTSAQLDAAIRELSTMLGPRLLQPLAEALRARGATEVCLIPVGVLGRVPLHSLSWEEGGHSRCLLDYLTTTFAPSAFSRAVCLRKASGREAVSSLLVVGNPLPHPDPLPGTELEAKVVADTLSASDLEVLIGPAATKEAVYAAMSGRSHIHLACHGSAAEIPGEFDSHLSFASNEIMTAAEILDLDNFRPRLVVASACETGVIPGYEEADEALALSTVLIGAGAAGVIASLWPVNDYATALLMTRFYELLEGGSAPGQALRDAQLWLRDLTRAEEDRYVATREALRIRRDQDRGNSGGSSGRFAGTRLWGGFSLSGA
jgi:CHAT domain-containing protein